MEHLMAVGVLTGIGIVLFLIILSFFFVLALAIDIAEKSASRSSSKCEEYENESDEGVEGEEISLDALRRRGEAVLRAEDEDFG